MVGNSEYTFLMTRKPWQRLYRSFFCYLFFMVQPKTKKEMTEKMAGKFEVVEIHVKKEINEELLIKEELEGDFRFENEIANNSEIPNTRNGEKEDEYIRPNDSTKYVSLPRKKKLSGAQNLKRKKSRLAQNGKNPNKFVKKSNKNDVDDSIAGTSCVEKQFQVHEESPDCDKNNKISSKENFFEKLNERHNIQNNQNYEESFENEEKLSRLIHSKAEIETTFEKNEDQTKSGPNINLVDPDPALWPTITDEIRQIIVQIGPLQIMDNFTRDEKGRSFSTFHYKRCLKNGEKVNRQWLLYSKSSNAIYCFCCILFTNEPKKEWPFRGTSDWKNTSRSIANHECSKQHINCFAKWKELENSLKKNSTIEVGQQQKIHREETHWKNVLEIIMSIIHFLTSQNLSFRGSSSKLFEHNNGNFLKLVELISMYNPDLKEHVRRIIEDESRLKVSCMIIDVQNELISILASKIRQKIIEDAKEALYYSIIVDCAPDKSGVEIMSLILRFVAKNANNKLVPREHFICFLPTTGAGLTELILKELDCLQLDIKFLRGQGYDNVANMKGRFSGVQSRILAINPRAFVVPCSCPCLNSVINDTASASGEIVNFFTIVQNLFDFLSGSVYRWDILKKYCKDLTLEAISTTSWPSRVDAIKLLRYNLLQILEAINDIADNANNDNLIRHEAKCIMEKLSNYKFICSVVIWNNILHRTNIVSNLLQSPCLNISVCLRTLNNTLEFLQTHRKNGFSKALITANEIAHDLGIEPNFPHISSVRLRQKKVIFSYEERDPKKQFEVVFFNFLLDIASNALQNWFKLLDDHSDIFQFLYNIPGIEKLDHTMLAERCDDLYLALKDGDSADVDATDLKEEIINLCRILPSNIEGPLDVLNFIDSYDLICVCPNVCVCLRILLTIPVSVATTERSLSKSKIIKNYLRSTIVQDRLCNLTIIAVEKEIAENLDFRELVDVYAKTKTHRVV